MRSRILALAGLLALPTLSSAQTVLQLPSARFAVTPFLGLQVPYGAGDRFLYTNDTAYRVAEERAGGPLVGAEVEARVSGPLGVVGSLAYGRMGRTSLTLRDEEGSDPLFLSTDGPEVWLGKLGLSYRLPEPDPDRRRFHPAGFLVAGPALVRTDFADDDASGQAWAEAVTHWGLNLGVHTATRLAGERLAFHLALEDFVTFWNTERVNVRDEAIYGQYFDDQARVDSDNAVSNLLVLRAGVSFRFR